jgi:sugar/nucleoside kinase (ribokinase family)
MQLVDANKSKEITSLLADTTPKMATGGSASNTINGLARLGVKTGFIGKIGKDEVGEFFMNDFIKNNVTPQLEYSTTASGQCTVLVTSDSERTLCTYLGASCELGADDIHADMFAGYDIFHIEGYLVQNHDLIRKALKLAKEAGLKVAIDLASYNVVEENLEFLQDVVGKYVDIVFANEEEARAFTSLEPEKALTDIAQICEIAVVKIGKDGSYVQSGEEVVKADARKANCIDTTGAGDLYAAGFLYGMASDYSLEVCAKIGSLVSANVVEVLGAKMTDEVWANVFEEIKKITK